MKLTLRNIIPLIILIEGFVSISIEILTIRQLLPVAGGSVIVTSLIIGIFLLFLALGYRRGGRVQSELPKALQTNFLISACWLGIGLSYSFIFLFFNFIQAHLTGTHLIYPLLSYLLLIVAPLIYILGQTIPITMNLNSKQRTAGILGGDTLGLSTLGSFLGATVTALVFMHFLGVAWTIVINFILLLILALSLCKSRFNLFMLIGFSIFSFWIVYDLNVTVEKKSFVLTDNYANYQIFQQGPRKLLSINNSNSSYINEQKKGFEYIEKIKTILFNDLKLSNADILVLGAGGFTLTAEKTNGNRFTYVDVDSQLKNVVVPQFLDEVNSVLIEDDARHFIKIMPKQYDAIIVDAYTNIMSIPSHLLTREYMETIENKLTPNGTVIFNMVGRPTLSDPYSKRVDNTIRAVFKNCMASPLKYNDELNNILYVCRKAQNQQDGTIYSDNKTTATTDSFDW